MDGQLLAGRPLTVRYASDAVLPKHLEGTPWQQILPRREPTAKEEVRVPCRLSAVFGTGTEGVACGEQVVPDWVLEARKALPIEEQRAQAKHDRSQIKSNQRNQKRSEAMQKENVAMKAVFGGGRGKGKKQKSFKYEGVFVNKDGFEHLRGGGEGALDEALLKEVEKWGEAEEERAEEGGEAAAEIDEALLKAVDGFERIVPMAQGSREGVDGLDETLLRTVEVLELGPARQAPAEVDLKEEDEWVSPSSTGGEWSDGEVGIGEAPAEGDGEPPNEGKGPYDDFFENEFIVPDLDREKRVREIMGDAYAGRV